MTKNQYENIVSETIKNESADKSGLDTVRNILKNLGIGFPKGNVKEITDALETEDFMGWRTCSLEEAKEYISNGIPVIGINDREISVIINPSEIGGPGYDVLYSYNGETTCDEFYGFQSGTYFINNKKTGKYLFSTSSAIEGRSGTFGSLGTSIRWKLILSEDNTYYIIYPINNAQRCLAVTASGVALVNRTNNPTDYMKWEIAYKPGGESGLYSIRNKGSSNYLKYENNSFGMSNNYDSEFIVWRIASVSQNVINSELTSSFKFNDLVFDIGESRHPEISEGSYNFLWAHLDDFEYNFDQSSSLLLAFDSNQLIFTGLGRCPAITISARHKVTNITVMFEVLIYSNIDNLFEMLGRLYDLSLSYCDYLANINYHPIYDRVQAFELCCNYIRRTRYDDYRFSIVIRPIETSFVEYVHSNSPEVEQYFISHGDGQGYEISVDDSVSENTIDAEHMFCVMDRLFFSGVLPRLLPIYTSQQLDQITGWAGDLQSLICDYYSRHHTPNATYDDIYNQFYSMLGSYSGSFSMSDLIADIDAENLSQLIHNLEEYDSDSITSCVYDYYNVGQNESYCGHRFSIWRSKYTDEEFENLVMSYCQTNIPGLQIPHLLFIDYPNNDYTNYPNIDNVINVVTINDNEKQALANAFISFINNLVQNEI